VYYPPRVGLSGVPAIFVSGCGNHPVPEVIMAEEKGISNATLSKWVGWFFNCLSVFVIPVFAWAWSLNADIAVLQEKVKKMEVQIERQDEDSRTLARLEERIETVKEGLDEIERILRN
jgi:hypothetical protein